MLLFYYNYLIYFRATKIIIFNIKPLKSLFILVIVQYMNMYQLNFGVGGL